MDIKDLKNLLTEKVKGILNKRKPETVQTTDKPDSEAKPSSPSTEPAGGGESKRLKALTFVAMAVIFFVVGGVLAYNYYFFSEKGTPQELTLSRPYQPPTPANAPVATNGGDDARATGQNIQEDKQAQTQKGTSGSVPPNEGKQVVQNESSPVSQSPAKKGAMRVSEHDPFKSEFEKKYQAAVKKEKRLSGSLGDLEGSIKEAKLNLPPTPPPPPPPPAPKQLKLAVFGTVISPNDTYAITDMGVIRVGNVVESFTVESIKFDMVILRQNDNKDEVRNIFIKARGRQADGVGGAMPIHAGGQQWPSSQ